MYMIIVYTLLVCIHQSHVTVELFPVTPEQVTNMSHNSQFYFTCLTLQDSQHEINRYETDWLVQYYYTIDNWNRLHHKILFLQMVKLWNCYFEMLLLPSLHKFSTSCFLDLIKCVWLIFMKRVQNSRLQMSKNKVIFFP